MKIALKISLVSRCANKIFNANLYIYFLMKHIKTYFFSQNINKKLKLKLKTYSTITFAVLPFNFIYNKMAPNKMFLFIKNTR